ncbi:FAD-dependent monooxygenase [Pigmentibacter sp. JX0631]|uniref:FAD-dependent monooxygenase n=1 Tax=Pigmentibacter sp. JX0631 TaxID=2976982 RepID=UPI0024698ACC|nr:FAD-dependent monooxygenase [Pigmentibacter sp. JX0631]WGL59468.1 FAD-dependent monooxygenase [Pigmentibacter sp. JX0631]
MKNEYEVVIAGGGPTGLMLACELALKGIKTLVLDDKIAESPQSRGATIHPRTAELLYSRGILEKFIEKGKDLLEKDPRLPLYHYAVMIKLKMYMLDSPCNFTLWLPQKDTEIILQNHALELGVDILKNHEVIHFEEHYDGVVVEVKHLENKLKFQAKYLVGCDGAKSKIRKISNIEMLGTNKTNTTLMADIYLDTPLAYSTQCEFSSKGVVVVMPAGKKLTRFVIISDSIDKNLKENSLDLDLIKKYLLDICGHDFGVKNSHWISSFGNANKLAKQLIKNRVILAGDAAHYHLPAGGQGLNYGIQDAFNLGWKLAAELKGWAPKWLLDSYQTERIYAGKMLMESVKKQESLLFRTSESDIAFRKYFEDVIIETDEVNKKLTQEIAGLHINYQNCTEDKNKLIGCRVPDLELFEDFNCLNLYNLFSRGNFVFICFTHQKFRLPEEFKDRLDIYHFKYTEKRFEFFKTKYLLIRPDLYIAWASDNLQSSVSIKKELNYWLKK